MFEIIRLSDEHFYCFVMKSANMRELFMSRGVECVEYVLADIEYCRKEIKAGRIRLTRIKQKGYSVDIMRNNKVVASAGIYTRSQNAKKAMRSALTSVDGEIIDKTNS